ncbi:MAG: OsmC family peroxiredoxin, partial [Deltaproteobacteria bacterium]
MIKKFASAVWQGGLKGGKGTVSTESGVMDDVPYGFNARFEGGKGSNPEELIAAAHAGCFSMALSGQLDERGITADKIETRATIHLSMDGGPTIVESHLDVTITAKGDAALIREAAEAAEKG